MPNSLRHQAQVPVVPRRQSDNASEVFRYRTTSFAGHRPFRRYERNSFPRVRSAGVAVACSAPRACDVDCPNGSTFLLRHILPVAFSVSLPLRLGNVSANAKRVGQFQGVRRHGYTSSATRLFDCRLDARFSGAICLELLHDACRPSSARRPRRRGGWKPPARLPFRGPPRVPLCTPGASAPSFIRAIRTFR